MKEQPGVSGLGDSLRMKVEQHVKLYVKPRPRWMPEFIYRRLMSRVVLYESLPTITVVPAEPDGGGS